MATETRPIDSIKVIGRCRKEMGNISVLASSIERVGLLHPIVINSRDELIVGSRRLAACKRIFWKTIPVTVANNLDDALTALKAERDENIFREPITVAEMVEMGRKLEALEKPEAKARQSTTGTAPGKPKNASGNLPEASGQTRDKVAAGLGVSGRTYEKAKQVTEAAKREPEKYADLPAKMEEKSVDAAYREMKERQKGPEPIEETATQAEEKTETAEPIEEDEEEEEEEEVYIDQFAYKLLEEALELINKFADTTRKRERLATAVSCIEEYLDE